MTGKPPHIESEHVCGINTNKMSETVAGEAKLPCEVDDSVYVYYPMAQTQTRICLIDMFWSGHWSKSAGWNQ